MTPASLSFVRVKVHHDGMRLHRDPRAHLPPFPRSHDAGLLVLVILGTALLLQAASHAPTPALAREVIPVRIEPSPATLKKPSPPALPRDDSATGPVSAAVTYYGIEDGYFDGAMYCGGEFNPADLTIAAVSPGRYPCGTRLVIGYPGTQRRIEVTVKDHCGRCTWNHLDLSRAAFAALGHLEQGRIEVVWTAVLGHPEPSHQLSGRGIAPR